MIANRTAFAGFLIIGGLYFRGNTVQAKHGLNALGLVWVNLMYTGQIVQDAYGWLAFMTRWGGGMHITRVV